MVRAFVLASIVVFSVNTVFALENQLDPSKVAPQYRDLAEKRQAELIRQKACQARAEKEKIVRRDLPAYVLQCMDAAEKAEQAVKAKK